MNFLMALVFLVKKSFFINYQIYMMSIFKLSNFQKFWGAQNFWKKLEFFFFGNILNNIKFLNNHIILAHTW